MPRKADEAVKLSVAHSRIIKARAHLLTDAPFWGMLALRLKLKEDPTCDTGWTDGVSIGFNPEFVATLNDTQLKGLLCHEVAHVALGHCWRKGWREHMQWNEACDYAINEYITNAGFLLPSGALFDAQYNGLPAETIYDRMGEKPKPPQNQQPPQPDPNQKDSDEESDDDSDEGSDADSDEGSEGKDGDGDAEGDGDSKDDSDEGSGKPDDKKDASPGKSKGKPGKGKKGGKGESSGDSSSDASDDNSQDPSASSGSKDPKGDKEPYTPKNPAGEVRQAPPDKNPEELEAEWRVAIDQAQKVEAMARGTLPGSTKELVDEALQPKVDWRSVLRAFFQQNCTTQDYTWRQPSARYLPRLYLPKLMGESIPQLVIVVDTSLSVGPRLLADFLAEIRDIIEELRPDETYLVHADTHVRFVQRFTSGEMLEFEGFAGRGGTLFTPTFKWVEDEGLNPACLIYLTDLDGDNPKEPDYPVLWVSPPTYLRAPFGEHVQMQD